MSDPYAPLPRKNTGMIVGMIGTIIAVLGLCSAPFVGYFCGPVMLGLPLIALIMGIIALSVAKNDTEPQQARTLGIVSTVLGALVLLIGCVLSILATLGIGAFTAFALLENGF